MEKKEISCSAPLKPFSLFICSSMKEEGRFSEEERKGAEIGLEKVT